MFWMSTKTTNTHFKLTKTCKRKKSHATTHLWHNLKQIFTSKKTEVLINILVQFFSFVPLKNSTKTNRHISWSGVDVLPLLFVNISSQAHLKIISRSSQDQHKIMGRQSQHQTKICSGWSQDELRMKQEKKDVIIEKEGNYVNWNPWIKKRREGVVNATV